MNKVNEILSLLKKEYPDAGPELNFSSNYELLIAVILSAQCTDVRVNKITEVLFKRANTAEQMIQVPLKELEQIIRTCGMFHQKAKNVLKASQTLVEKYGGEVPNSFDDLIELAGVGQKTANVVMSCAFDVPAIAVDTHVKRLAFRLGFTKHTQPEKVEEDLKRLIPKEEWSLSHHLLIFHGRRCCKARKPDCLNCVVEEYCPKKGVSK